MIQLTPAAIAEVRRMVEKQTDAGVGLRMLVRGGGCSGLSYDLNFDKRKEKDHEFDFEGLKVYVDPKSYLYLDGTT